MVLFALNLHPTVDILLLHLLKEALPVLFPLTLIHLHHVDNLLRIFLYFGLNLDVGGENEKSPPILFLEFHRHTQQLFRPLFLNGDMVALVLACLLLCDQVVIERLVKIDQLVVLELFNLYCPFWGASSSL